MGKAQNRGLGIHDGKVVDALGHPMNPVSVGDDLVERAAEIIWNDLYGARAGAWDNPPADSVAGIQMRATARAALTEAAARIIAVEAERGIVERNRDAARENFLTMQGAAAKLLEDANSYKAAAEANLARATKAEARNAVLEAALTKADHALMVVQCAIDEDTTALNDCLWVPERFGPNESVLDFVGAARAALTPEPS